MATRRVGPGALPATVKSLNYLNNIMAKIEAKQAGALEAIMLNDQGYVAECTADNVFIVRKGEVLTPAATHGALQGITRGAAIDIARELGLQPREAELTRYDIWCADECFLTGTGAEVIPVVKLDGREIGTGQPGPATQRVGESVPPPGPPSRASEFEAESPPGAPGRRPGGPSGPFPAVRAQVFGLCHDFPL